MLTKSLELEDEVETLRGGPASLESVIGCSMTSSILSKFLGSGGAPLPVENWKSGLWESIGDGISILIPVISSGWRSTDPLCQDSGYVAAGR